MKNISLIVSGIIFSSLISVADEVAVKTDFKQGDIVEVSSCDNFGWCRLADKSGFIKKFWFKQISSNQYQKRGKGVTYLYVQKYKDTKIHYEKSLIDIASVEKALDNNSTFEAKIAQADGSFYTITLLKSYIPRVESFKKKYMKDKKEYLVKSSKSVSQLVMGVFETKEQAQEYLALLSTKIKKDAFLTKISTLRKQYNISQKTKVVIRLPEKKEVPKIVEEKEIIPVKPKKMATVEEAEQKIINKKVKVAKKLPQVKEILSVKPKVVKELPQIKEVPKQIEKQEQYLWLNNFQYFVGFAINYNSLDVSKKDTTGSILVGTPKNSALGYNLNVGAYLFDNYVLSFNYDRTDLDTVDMTSYYFSLDYTFKQEYNPFLGITFGKIIQSWNIDPLVNSQTKDNDISSYLYGIEGGIKHKINDKFFFVAKGIYQKFNLKTNLISAPAKSLIEYKDKKAIEMGVRYEF